MRNCREIVECKDTHRRTVSAYFIIGHKSNRLNVGGLSFTYGLETDDTVGSSYVFNAHDASWITFVRGLFPACQTMYRNRESAGCFNSANFLAKMKAYQDTRPERLWVADAQRKYLRPYEDNGTETYIPMLAGKKTHQREQVKTYNAYYYASKYVSDFCTSQNVMVRGNTPTSGTSITVVPPANTAKVSMYIDCYIVVASTSYNVVAKTKAKRGTTYTMDFSTIGSMGETELYFCSAPMITELGDLAHLYFKQNNFAMGTNIQRLEIGSGVAGYENPNLENLTIGNNKMLEYLDVRNCPNATGALDLTGCSSLKEVYLENTAFTGISFASAGLLQKAHLPSPTSVSLRELTYLTDLLFESTNNINTLRIENCDFIPSAKLTIDSAITTQEDRDIILTLVTSSPNLSRVRLLGVDWNLADSGLLEGMYSMAGIDDDGYDSLRSVLSGQAYIYTVRQSQLDKYTRAWPYFTITYNSIVTQYQATFLNYDGTPIYDRNGDSYSQYIDAGSTPYNPITMGYDITLSGNGNPSAAGYDATDYNEEYYLDIQNGYIYGSDGVSWRIVEESDVLTPTLASTDQYIYTFSGWSNLSTPMSGNRNITAQYSTTDRTYTVRFYRDSNTILRTITDVPYGGCVDYADTNTIIGYGIGSPALSGYTASNYPEQYYQDVKTGALYYSNGANWMTTVQILNEGTIPTWTNDEYALVFRVFNGWDKSTGFIRSDTNVYAQWITTNGAMPSESMTMQDMTIAQICQVCKTNSQDGYFEPLDYYDVTLGHDFNFSGINSITIGPRYDSNSTESVLALTGIDTDQYVSGGYYFNGTSSYYQTNISLFGENSPSFTMALDFDMTNDTSQGTLISANYGATTNFRIYNDGNYVQLQWGDKSVRVGYKRTREMVVIRHEAGSNSIIVYTACGSSATQYATNITRTTLTRSTSAADEPLTLGAVNYHTTSNTYRNFGKGHIHWMKIWYEDLGNTNAYKLAIWPHEKMHLEYWGCNKYDTSDESGMESGASFIANAALAHRGYYMNSSSSNSGGWGSSMMRTFLNNRFLLALPVSIQAAITQVQINALTGNASTGIATSNDKVYLASAMELNMLTGAGYQDEIGVDLNNPSVPWFVNQSGYNNASSYNTASAQRAKWGGRIREYALPDGNTIAYDGVTPYIYYTSSNGSNYEPSNYFNTDITPGSIWRATTNYTYIFVSQDELDQYGISPSVTAAYASGGWVVARYWWTRSTDASSNTFVGVQDSGSSVYAGGSGTYGIVPCLSISQSEHREIVNLKVV